jgi:AraC family transcriptional regulator
MKQYNIISRIETLRQKKLIGKKLKMSLTNNNTFALWQSFMPMRKQITNSLSTDLISMQVYSGLPDWTNFSQEFDKWAAMEVSDFNHIPDGMEAFTLPDGLYAVFDYKGLHTDEGIFRYIFGIWLPNSAYNLDDRPHFEILGEKYKNNDPGSEEEIWIPIKHKKSVISS